MNKRWIIRVLNHKILRFILVILCSMYLVIYIFEIRREKAIISLNDAFPTLLDRGGNHRAQSLRRMNPMLSPRTSKQRTIPMDQLKYIHDHNGKIKRILPFQTDQIHENSDLNAFKSKNPSLPLVPYQKGVYRIVYNKEHSLRINIAIPTSCNQKDGRLRKMQRLSWFKYLEDDKLWNSMHAQCKMSIKYYVGDCGDSASNQMIKNEKKAHSDIVQMDGIENWEGLQRKTIDIIISEYLDKERPYDVLFKTDTDSYVNLPNLCGYLIKLMNENGWNGQQKALYLGALQDDTKIIIDQSEKYANIDWLKRIRRRKYSAFMSGFGYFLSYKTTQIIHDSLSEIKDEIAFNPLEDTFIGHHLATFDVKFVDIGKVIQAWPKPTVSSLNNDVIDHWYNNQFAKEDATLMIEKYKLHCRLHRDYLSKSDRDRRVSAGYPRMRQYVSKNNTPYSPKLLLR